MNDGINREKNVNNKKIKTIKKLKFTIDYRYRSGERKKCLDVCVSTCRMNYGLNPDSVGPQDFLYNGCSLSLLLPSNGIYSHSV